MSHLSRNRQLDADVYPIVQHRLDVPFREFTGYTPPVPCDAPSRVDAIKARIASGQYPLDANLDAACIPLIDVLDPLDTPSHYEPCRADLGAVEPEPALYEDNDGNQSSGEREAMPLILLAGLIGFALIGWIGWRLAVGAFGG